MFYKLVSMVLNPYPGERSVSIPIQFIARAENENGIGTAPFPGSQSIYD